ncbi:hypothetical protein [Mesobacillus stamsii]|uniref:Uncharacterized protein n=1 Tax=Mesobacillus stamsii TaxID=225347 RepID=A0ABU0G087_9BACI|nr:hypothetical protein [Mesobacillus stamsii]MDQ0414987.1 hypothetical protein [Mesobacillus stamsii]
METPLERIKATIDGYKRLLAIIEQHADSEGVCKLSKMKISLQYGISYTGTLKKLGCLEKHNLIIKTEGGFKRTGKDVLEDTPFSLLLKLLLLVIEKPEIYSSFKQQAEILNVSFDDVRSAWGFYGYFFGTKYPSVQEANE